MLGYRLSPRYMLLAGSDHSILSRAFFMLFCTIFYTGTDAHKLNMEDDLQIVHYTAIYCLNIAVE